MENAKLFDWSMYVLKSHWEDVFLECHDWQRQKPKGQITALQNPSPFEVLPESTGHHSVRYIHNI